MSVLEGYLVAVGSPGLEVNKCICGGVCYCGGCGSKHLIDVD